MMHRLEIAIMVTGLLVTLTISCSGAFADQGGALIEVACKKDLKRLQSFTKIDGGKMVLMAACLMGEVDCVKLLIYNGVDINARDKDGETALMIASHKGHLDVARLLLDKGADAKAKTKYGWTALMAASKNGHTQIVELLKAHGAKE